MEESSPSNDLPESVGGALAQPQHPPPESSQTLKMRVVHESGYISSATETLNEDGGDGEDAESSSSDDEDFVDLTEFFLWLQRRDWEKVYEFLQEHPVACRQAVHSKKGVSPLLHIVLRHGPPLPVVDVLLAHLPQPHDEATTGESAPGTSPSVWKQFDTQGKLPLHAVCSCGPDASLDVVSKLLRADPEALRVRTRDGDNRFPLHLAVVTNAREDVVMELMIHFPEASFVPDAHGKIPIEYAKDSCYGHNRLVVALEWAPMFLAATQAAYKRVSEATETKLQSLREAHASYEEQLEERYNGEKMILVREQIQCSNELTNEKERNILLAKAMLEMQQTEEDLLKERDLLRAKLDRELFVRRTRAKLRDEELKEILLGKRESSDSGSDDGNTIDIGDDEINKDKTCQDRSSAAPEDAGAEGGMEALRAASSNLPLPRLLKQISDGYETSKRRNELYKKSLERQRATTLSLNQLLATKESELQQAYRKSRCDEITLQAAIDRAEDLAKKQESALEQLSSAQKEVERLRTIGLEKERKLSHSQRRLRIQEKRLSGIQDLIDSLRAARSMDAERLDLIREESDSSDEGESSFHNEKGRAMLPMTPITPTLTTTSMGMQKAPDLSLDLSVEIEMAAMAAAHLDDDIENHESIHSFGKSHSERRHEADLSAELDAAMAMERAKTPDRSTNMSALGESPEQERALREPTNEAIANQWDVGKGAARGTPRTASVTTRSLGDGEDESTTTLQTNMPETPPVPEQVMGSANARDYDLCSPLGTPPKLDFTRDS
jgi:hypothetical protein